MGVRWSLGGGEIIGIRSEIDCFLYSFQDYSREVGMFERLT